MNSQTKTSLLGKFAVAPKKMVNTLQERLDVAVDGNPSRPAERVLAERMARLEDERGLPSAPLFIP